MAGRPKKEDYIKNNTCPKCGYCPPWKQPASRKGKMRGVSYSEKRNKFSARIRLGGKNHFIGEYFSELEAAKAYDSYASYYIGANAILNFPK